MKTAPLNRVVLWQSAQFVGKPAATWFGFVVELNRARWQLTHVVDLPAYTLSEWHEAHAKEVCAPVNGNRVTSWLNLAPVHCDVL